MTQTAFIMLDLRCKAQAHELSRQRERIFALKQMVKKLAKVISRKHNELQQIKEECMGGKYTDKTFVMSDKEYETYEKWYEEHKKTGCRFTGYTGAIGGGLIFSFFPTSLGSAITVKCGCGEEINITDYESW